MAKESKTIRLPTPDAERVEEYADDMEMSEADAYRRLVRRGLRSEGYDDPHTTTRAFENIVTFQRLVLFGLVLTITILLDDFAGGFL